MSDGSSVSAGQQELNRLVRHGSEGTGEVSIVTSPGARVAAWPVKVAGLASYNVYNVQQVSLGDSGSLPVIIGPQMQAVNLAESFIQQGQLAAGTYVIMFRAGEKNVFYAPVQ